MTSSLSGLIKLLALATTLSQSIFTAPLSWCLLGLTFRKNTVLFCLLHGRLRVWTSWWLTGCIFQGCLGIFTASGSTDFHPPECEWHMDQALLVSSMPFSCTFELSVFALTLAVGQSWWIKTRIGAHMCISQLHFSDVSKLCSH